MSQFDKHTTSQFVEAMRLFLGIKKEGFLKEYGFISKDFILSAGRPPRFNEAAVEALISKMNEKAQWAESGLTSLGERIYIARNYMSMTDASIGKKLGVSREMVRLWRNDVNAPKDIATLATTLNVPTSWLARGCQEDLPPNTHIGVRLGDESLACREQLKALTLRAFATIDKETDLSSIQRQLESAVYLNKDMATVARRAGGRWQHDGKNLVFSPWVPIQKRELVRRYWSDEIEAIIKAALAKNKSIYAAWLAIEKQCNDLGIDASMYPTEIALYKRKEKATLNAKRFGTDMNVEVNNSLNEELNPH
jgi:hypothetical protein